MNFVAAAKRIAAYRQAITCSTALVLFWLFAGTVAWLHRTAQVDSPTLGVSPWAEKAATQDRVTRALEVPLQQASVAAGLAADPDVVSQIGPKDDSYVNAWKGLDAIAQALTGDASREHLANLWEAQLATYKDEIGTLARTGMASTAKDRGSNLLGVHHRALDSAIETWLSIELSSSRVESLLADGNATALPVQNKAEKKADKGRADKRQPATAATPRISAMGSLAATIHARCKDFVTRRIHAELGTILARDLDPLLAQSVIAGAVHKDFAARWMWIISAALFLTFAASAIVGAVPRLRSLVDKEHQFALIASFMGTVILVALLGHRFIDDVGPAFLLRPVRELATTFEIDLASTVSFLNVLAAAAIAALLVTAWASFLIPTRDEKHLDVQLATLRWVLHTATLVLVAGVFETYALTHWPTALMVDPAANMVESGAQIASLAIGVALSTLLLLIYVPGAVALTEEARRRQTGADENRRGQIDAMISRHGFDTSATKLITTFAQLLLPLLITAPLSGLVNLLGS